MKLIFYDLDNTLYNQTYDVEQRIDKCLKIINVNTKNKVKEYWINEWKDNGPKKNNIINVVFDEFAIKNDIQQILKIYRNTKTNLKIDKQVVEFLINNKKQNIKQIVITNGNKKVQVNKIKSLGLANIFDEIIISTGDYAKPSPYWINKMMKKYNCNPIDCVFIGDWYEIDGKTAENASIKFIHIKGGPIKENLPENISSLESVSDITEI